MCFSKILAYGVASCFSDAFWELINYWNYLECKGPEIVHLYTKYGIDAEISQLYQEYLDSAISAKRLVTEVRLFVSLFWPLRSLFLHLREKALKQTTVIVQVSSIHGSVWRQIDPIFFLLL